MIIKPRVRGFICVTTHPVGCEANVKNQIDYVKAHLARFRRIDDEVSNGRIDEGWLADLEKRDNIFPELDFRTWA